MIHGYILTQNSLPVKQQSTFKIIHLSFYVDIDKELLLKCFCVFLSVYNNELIITNQLI